MPLSKTLIRTAVATALLGLGAGTTALAQDTRGERGWHKGEPIDIAVMEQRIAERAAAMDADGDGIITAEERRAYREARMAEHRSRMAERGITRDDARGERGSHRGGKRGMRGQGHGWGMDGDIAVEDYIARQVERFERMDVDGDGQVSRDEMQAWHEQMRERRAQRRAGGDDA